ncbi:MAG TPA: 4Fe-4S binding protein [Anaerolineaceae bacterium]|nr:4Fe-4S binding protein [Anaerolineaceae bacterium]
MTSDTARNISLETYFCGQKLQSPFILSSGPLSYGAEGIIAASQAGFGAVVTKTLRLKPAINPPHHIGLIGTQTLINCEKWSDIDFTQWCEYDIPQSVKNGTILIASLGHTLDEVKVMATAVEKAGAQMVELVSYREDDLLPMLDYAKSVLNIPVICKLSANWTDVVGTAQKCLVHQTDGICAIDSIGPTLKIDIEHAQPALLGELGAGWLSGEAIRPISMWVNAEISRRNPEFQNLYSSGGCFSAKDAIEFLMAGATAVGLCSAVMLKGLSFVDKLCNDLADLLPKLGYHSLSEVRGVALRNLQSFEAQGELEFTYQAFRPDGSKKCIDCKKCEIVCPYKARHVDFPIMTFDRNRCRSCGLCVDICPTEALTAQVVQKK